MKREIKFEYGFESVNGIIKKVYHLHQIPNIKEICDCWNVLPLAYERQFTGLKDKHGVDIYEGDICEFIDHPTNLDSCITDVKFSEGNFIDGLMGWTINYYGDKWTEVIGNIYENPELLNK